jgi:hypothetical protein
LITLVLAVTVDTCLNRQLISLCWEKKCREQIGALVDGFVGKTDKLVKLLIKR